MIRRPGGSSGSISTIGSGAEVLTPSSTSATTTFPSWSMAPKRTVISSTCPEAPPRQAAIA